MENMINHHLIDIISIIKCEQASYLPFTRLVLAQFLTDLVHSLDATTDLLTVQDIKDFYTKWIKVNLPIHNEED